MIRVLPAGDRALLVEVDDLETVLALARQLTTAIPAGVTDVVPAARTVLVRTVPGGDLTLLATELKTTAERAAGDPRVAVDPQGLTVIVPVRYDGPDLADAAAELGLSQAELIRAHTRTLWYGAFSGFAPGFCYLTGDATLTVPRRAESRTSVPAGSVALAGGFSAVYPRQSPGGWQLIGNTDLEIWDVKRDPPALIVAGSTVRFVDVDATPDETAADRAS